MFQSFLRDLDRNIPDTFETILSNIQNVFSSYIEDPPIQQFIDSGLLPYVLHFFKKDLRTAHPSCLLPASLIMINVCMGNIIVLELVVANQFIPLVSSILEETKLHKEILENIVWSLSNLVGSQLKMRDLILTTNIPELVGKWNIAFKNIYEIDKVCVWFFSNLLRGSPFPNFAAGHMFIPFILDIFAKYEDDAIDMEGAWGISYFVEPASNKQERIMNAGYGKDKVIMKLIRLLESNNPKLVSCCARIFGNLTAGPNDFVDYLVDKRLIEVGIV